MNDIVQQHMVGAHFTESTPIWYLAAPYSHDSELVRSARHEAITFIAAYLANNGICVFSPLTHSVPLEQRLSLVGVHRPNSFWVNFDKPFMAACRGLIIACLPGWETSHGVTLEGNLFAEARKPVFYMGWPYLRGFFPPQLLAGLENREQDEQPDTSNVVSLGGVDADGH